MELKDYGTYFFMIFFSQAFLLVFLYQGPVDIKVSFHLVPKHFWSYWLIIFWGIIIIIIIFISFFCSNCLFFFFSFGAHFFLLEKFIISGGALVYLLVFKDVYKLVILILAIQQPPFLSGLTHHLSDTSTIKQYISQKHTVIILINS